MKKDYQYIEIQLQGPVVRINLNRPERHNALIPELIGELIQALDEIAAMDELLFVVLRGNGRSFCAGADLNWFSGADERLAEENAEQYKMLAELLLKLFQLPQVSVSAVHGNVFGGGIGLMAVCDFVLADPLTRFTFSEVKLGLLPATILPLVAKRISIQHQRKWILTGSLFNATEACQAGLVDQVAEECDLETYLKEFMDSFDMASPSAIKMAKVLINKIASGKVDMYDTDLTSKLLAEALLSSDGQEGIQAFMGKRTPLWGKPHPQPFSKGEGGEEVKILDT